MKNLSREERGKQEGMKKRLLILLLFLAMMLSGCSPTKTAKEFPEGNLMTIVDKTDNYTIFMHDETGVMYFCRDGGYGRSSCVMLDADGKPFIYK